MSSVPGDHNDISLAGVVLGTHGASEPDTNEHVGALALPEASQDGSTV
jgi:hypothetical protein